MSTGLFSVSSFGQLAAENGVVAATHSILSALTETTLAGASALTPPGGEGASVKAVASQIAAVQQFGAMANVALEQITEHTASTSIFGATTEGANLAEAANLAAVTLV